MDTPKFFYQSVQFQKNNVIGGRVYKCNLHTFFRTSWKRVYLQTNLREAQTFSLINPSGLPEEKSPMQEVQKNVRRTYIPFLHWLILTMNNKTYSASSSLLNNTLWLDEWVCSVEEELSPKCSQKLFGGHHTCYGVQSDHFNRSICWKKVLDSSKRNISNYRLWSQDFLKRLLSLKKGETTKESCENLSSHSKVPQLT